MDNEKAIRAAKLTLGGILEKRRAKTAVERAQGQIAPSKYLPDVPRQVHASGGYVPMASLPIPKLAVASPLAVGQQPGLLDVIGTLNKVAGSARTLSDLVRPEREEAAREPHAERVEAKAEGLTPEASAAMEALRKGWTGSDFGIVSGYRDPEHNERVGGAKDSQHTHGNAYDVDTTGWSPEDKLALADAAWNAGFRGFGFYDNNMHFDVAGPRAWGPSHSRDSIPDWAQGWAQERYGYAEGGEVTDLGQVREQKQMQTYHTGMMDDIHQRMTNAMEAHEKAVGQGVFDGYEVGDTLQGSAHPMRITGRYMQKWKPTSMALRSFERMGTEPTIIEHEGEQYIPMLRYETGKEGVDGFQQGSAYLDGVKAAGYQKMGGLRAVRARGGAVEFMRDNHPLVPDELYHGNALKVVENQKYHGDGKWTSEIDQEATDRNIAAQDFREFKPSSHGNYGPGIYLTDKPEVASDFAQGIRADQKEPRPHGQVMKLHASIKQPFHDDVLRNPAWKDYIKSALTQYSIPHGEDRDARDAILKALDNGTATVRDLFLRDTPRGTLVNQHGQHDIHDTIRNSGFDGIIAHRPDGSKEYVAFKPEQVKSALSARKFDPTSPDMTYADGGAVGMGDDEVPQAPGQSPIPEDHVRLYHQTSVENIPSIMQSGLMFAHAKGYEGPKAIYADEKGFYGKPGQVPTIEFSVHKDRWRYPPFVQGDVDPKSIIAAHLPWHGTARYIEEDDRLLKDVLSGEHDHLLDDQGSNEARAINYIKKKYAATKAEGGSVDVPQKTVKAYKLFRTKGDGKLYPLFVNADKPVPMGEWLEAEEGPQGKAEGRVKSKIGDLAYRPGWHAGDLPIATHIGGKSDPSLKKPDYRPDNHVWAEVEMAADKDWQSVANSRGKGVKAHITDQVPYGGFYRYKTNPNMTGNWLIGGNMKVNRVLPDEEVKAINDAAGTADLPRRSEGFAAGGAAMFEGMHEDLQNEDGTPKELWHGTPHEGAFDEFDNSRLGERDAGFYGRGHYLAPDKDTANEYTVGQDDVQWGGQIVGPLHAALKNPYIWDASDRGAHSTLRDLQSMGIMKGQGKLEPWDNLQRHHIDPFMREMQKRGHDGVVVRTNDYTGEKPHKVSEVVVFKPSAIKHKDAKSFDPNDPNIYHARGGVAK